MRGGYELAGFALIDPVWSSLQPQMLPLVNAVLTGVGRPAITGIARV